MDVIGNEYNNIYLSLRSKLVVHLTEFILSASPEETDIDRRDDIFERLKSIDSSYKNEIIPEISNTFYFNFLSSILDALVYNHEFTIINTEAFVSLILPDDITSDTNFYIKTEFKPNLRYRRIQKKSHKRACIGKSDIIKLIKEIITKKYEEMTITSLIETERLSFPETNEDDLLGDIVARASSLQAETILKKTMPSFIDLVFIMLTENDEIVFDPLGKFIWVKDWLGFEPTMGTMADIMANGYRENMSINTVKKLPSSLSHSRNDSLSPPQIIIPQENHPPCSHHDKKRD